MNQDTKRTVLWCFLAFFGVVLLVNAGMVTLALESYTGLVTKHPYEEGLAYNKVVRAEAAQKALGWRGRLAFTPVPDIEGHAAARFRFTLRDAKGALLHPETLHIALVRPTQSGMDFSHDLKRADIIVFPARGLWEAQVVARIDDKVFHSTKRVVLP